MRSHAAAVAVLMCVPALCLTIDAPNIGMSKMIPTQGDTIAWQVPVINEGKEAFEGSVTVSIRSARRGDGLSAPQAVARDLKLAPDASEDFEFEWTPERNGYHRVVFEIDGLDVRVSRDVAVTKDDVYFVWFGAPKEFSWCNVPTTVKPEERDWWLRRGAIPCGWKCGVCCKEKTVDEFVKNWGSLDWIAIDEVGGPGEVTDKFIAAWKQLKQDKPDQFTAVWYMGAHEYWADIKDLVDLFVPEIYLNYRGNHLGQFDSYLQTAREAGVMDQVIPSLGINQIKDKDTERITNSPTREDVLRQFRYIKRTAPELKGIGFFTAYSAAWGVAEYADQLCEDYYIKPVLTICNPGEPFSIADAAVASKADSKAETVPFDHWAYDAVEKLGIKMRSPNRWLRVKVRNVGGMDAQDVAVEWLAERDLYLWRIIGEDAVWQRQTVAGTWPVGEEKTFELQATNVAGPVRFRIVPRAGYTVLDAEANAYLADSEWELPVTVPPGTPSPVPLPGFRDVPGDGPYELRMKSVDRQRERPTAVLPPRPGVDEKLAAFPLPACSETSYRAGVLEPAETAKGAPPQYVREANMLTVSNPFYEAQLNLATDSIASIVPDGGENLLRDPWVLSAAGHEEFGEARVSELPGCLVVTIPYDSEQASGESQYVFFSYTPAVRVARSWQPKGEVNMQGASDRCGLFQRGGTFALQPGVGGQVRRGTLHDGDKYRDLLFGYLGGRPGPENADKAGWIDFSYGDGSGGLGVAIDYRWEDSDTKSYDVTRLYDASDWLEVLYLWGVEKTFSKPQKSCVYLIPHGPMDLGDEAVVAPAKALWDQLHREQLAWTGEG